MAPVLEHERRVMPTRPPCSQETAMNCRLSNSWGAGRALAVLTLTGVLLTTSGKVAAAQNPAEALAGAWVIQVTLRNCATNAPLGPPFNSLVSFHRGGTVSESAGGTTFAPGQRSPGHGTWTHLGGNTFRQRMAALINFDTAPNLPGTPGFNPSLPVSPGFLAGGQTVTHTVTVTDANHLTSTGTNQFFKSDGTPYRSGCSTATAFRF
jgi:hypothetical protein